MLTLRDVSGLEVRLNTRPAIFISYRRSHLSELRRIKRILVEVGIQCFLDVEDIDPLDIDVQMLRRRVADSLSERVESARDIRTHATMLEDIEQARDLGSKLEESRGVHLLLKVGLFEITLGQYAGARIVETRALDVARRVLGEEHPDTLGSMNNLAKTLRAQGEIALILIATDLAQIFELELRFHAFGNHMQIETVRKRHDGVDDRRILRVLRPRSSPNSIAPLSTSRHRLKDFRTVYAKPILAGLHHVAGRSHVAVCALVMARLFPAGSGHISKRRRSVLHVA